MKKLYIVSAGWIHIADLIIKVFENEDNAKEFISQCKDKEYGWVYDNVPYDYMDYSIHEIDDAKKGKNENR